MSVETSLSFKGLVTSPNHLGAASEGALVVADNVTIRYPDVLEPRKGQQVVEGVVDAALEIRATWYTGFGYIVEAEGHTFTTGQTVVVNTEDLENPVEIVITNETFNQFTVVTASPWPLDTSLPNGAISYYIFTYLPTATVTLPVSQVAFFDGGTLLHSADEEKLKFVGEDALTGSYTAADPDFRLKTAVIGGSLYAATNQGVIAVDAATTTVPRVAGIKEPTLPIGIAVPDGSPGPTIPGFLPDGKSVAYRVLYGYKDSDGIINLGPASARVVVENTSGGRASVVLTVSLLTAPTNVNGNLLPGLFLRAYRSPIADATATPLDILNLATEVAVDTENLTTTDTVEVVDVAAPEFVLAQAALYSNAEQGEQPNTPPPFAYADLATWNDRLWYANTRLPDTLSAQLIGVEGGGSPDLPATGLRIGDSIVIDPVGPGFATFTASTSTDFVNRTFELISSGNPAENITATLKNLAECVNAQKALITGFDFNIVAYVTGGPFAESDADFSSNIVFKRNGISEAADPNFTVNYDVLRRPITISGTSGNYTVTSTGPHYLLEGDRVQLIGTSAPVIEVVVEAPVTATSFHSSSTEPTFVAHYFVRRLYGETVWNPDLLPGQSSDNDHQVNQLYYSKVQAPEAVPLLNYLNVGRTGNAIRRIVPQRDRLLVFKDEGTYAVYGDYPFSVSLVDDTVQILAPDSVMAVGSTVFALMDDGVVAITEGSIQPVSDPIDFTLMPYLSEDGRAVTTTGAFGVAYESQKLYALFFPALTGYGSEYAAKAYVLGLRSQPMAWTTWTFSTPMTCGRVDPVTDAGYYGKAETPWLVRDRNTSTTLDYQTELNGPISSTVQWASTTLGSPYATKQAREVHAHFRDTRLPLVATMSMNWSVKTDIVTNPSEVIPMLETSGLSVVSSKVLGPTVLPQQFRKLVPQAVQRATYYTLGFTSAVNKAYWALNGYSLVFDATSERTGTVR